MNNTKTSVTPKAKQRPSGRKRSGRPDLYQDVTNQIVAVLEQGVRPWAQPWDVRHAAGRVSRPLRHTGEPYQGINVLMLWMGAVEGGFASPYWLTFRQAKQLGGVVRKGERGSRVVYAGRFTKQETDDNGDDVAAEIPFLKGYTVFNADQIDGLPERYHRLEEPVGGAPEPIEEAERFFAATGADIRAGGDRACYAPREDSIRVPPLASFRDAESHAATVAHELVHWVGHPSRLDRDLGGERFGDAGYAMEELVAELGAAFLCADLGLTAEVREDHASYLDHWLGVLKQDNRAIFTAASHASRAASFLWGLQGQE